MSRTVLAWNRLATFVVALAVIAIGLVIAAWGDHELDRLFRGTGDTLVTARAATVYALPWWRPASIVAGIVLMLLALWWLLAHLPRTSVAPLRLPGSGRSGRLSLNAGSAVATAADVLAEAPGIHSATGRMKRTRGQLVAEMRVSAGPTTDLAELSARIDAVTADLHHVLARDDVLARVRVRITSHDRAQARVV